MKQRITFISLLLMSISFSCLAQCDTLEMTIESCRPIYYWGYLLNKTVDTTKQFSTPEGCVDSLLHFILKPSENIEETVDTCDWYDWRGRRLTESNVYRDTVLESNGCKSFYTLNLTVNQTPPFDHIIGTSNIVVASIFSPGEYVYYVDDSTGMDPNTIQWDLSDNEHGEWGFWTNGGSCSILAYSLGTKTLSVKGRGYEHCNKEVKLTINCSGFAVGENEIMHLEVYPNPASKELFVKGEDLRELLLYNMMGQCVRTMTVQGESEARLELEGLSQALYILEVHTKKGNKTHLISVINE